MPMLSDVPQWEEFGTRLLCRVRLRVELHIIAAFEPVRAIARLEFKRYTNEKR